jgi:hypothetical protein
MQVAQPAERYSSSCAGISRDMFAGAATGGGAADLCDGRQRHKRLAAITPEELIPETIASLCGMNMQCIKLRQHHHSSCFDSHNVGPDVLILHPFPAKLPLPQLHRGAPGG